MMASRYDDLLNNRKNSRDVARSEGGLAAKRPNKTKPGDHLSSLVIRARDGKWDDLVEYVNSDEPLTPDGRAAVALLLKQLLERRAGGPSATPTDDEEALQVAVWFMHAARDVFIRQSEGGRNRLRPEELKLLATEAAAKINLEYPKLASSLTREDLIGSDENKSDKKSPYEVGPTNHAEYLIVDELRHCARPIASELVEVLVAYDKSYPVKQ